jgi:hypothetical protein
MDFSLAVVQISATGFAPPCSGLDGKRVHRDPSHRVLLIFYIADSNPVECVPRPIGGNGPWQKESERDAGH